MDCQCGPQNWPQRSPDLNHIHVHEQGYTKKNMAHERKVNRKETTSLNFRSLKTKADL
jgi:hypothetical protein